MKYIVKTTKPDKLNNLCSDVGSPRSLTDLFIVEYDDSIDKLEQVEGVQWVEEDSKDGEDDFAFANEHQQVSGITPSINKTGKGVDVYVFDSVGFDHPEFDDRFVPLFNSKKGDQQHTHGTAVGSLVGGNTVGIAPQCTIKHSGYNFNVSEGVKAFDIISDDYD